MIKNRESWLRRNRSDLTLLFGLGMIVLAGWFMGSPLVGLAIPGGILVLIGLAPLGEML